MKSGSQSRKMTETSLDEEGMKVEVQHLAELENVTKATPVVSRALLPVAESAF